ncbi:hypothetical protein Patl1_30684 [Pistacia atlantica]|uniref:Uncharacterized protein n=1 Tax=Pistacia atlantica TaxID=434234 RepID=A0ACC1ABE5_9ROSI|nr:hypothetical protein Patl1_30684 [Pistacia atlantica]
MLDRKALLLNLYNCFHVAVLLCWVTQDFELYAAFDPLADKASAIKTCNRVCQWVKDVENEIFLQGASPFSW